MFTVFSILNVSRGSIEIIPKSHMFFYLFYHIFSIPTILETFKKYCMFDNKLSYVFIVKNEYSKTLQQSPIHYKTKLIHCEIKKGVQ